MKSYRIKWVLVSGIIGFLLVLLSSFSVNEAATSLFRGAVAFAVASVIGLVLSFVWDLVSMDLKKSTKLPDPDRDYELRNHTSTDTEHHLPEDEQ